MKKLWMIITVCVATLLLYCFMSTSVSAFSAVAGYSYSDNTLRIAGCSEIDAERSIVAYIIPGTEFTESIGDMNPQAVFMLPVDSDGNFVYSVPLDSEFPSGFHGIWLCGNNEKEFISLYTMKKPEVDALLGEISVCTDKNELREKLGVTYYTLGIKDDIWNKQKKLISTLLFKALAEGVNNDEELVRAAERACLAASVKADIPDLVFAILNEFWYAFSDSDGEVCANQLGLLSEEAGGKLAEKLDTSVIEDSERVIEVLTDACVLANVAASQSIKELSEYLLSQDTPVNFDFTYYKKLTEKSSAFREVYVKRGRYTSVNDIQKDFLNITKTLAYGEDNPNVSSPSGIGGGGGSVDKVVTKTEEVREAFSDVAGHWAANEINILLKNKTVSGYPDGSFRPDNFVTRAEFVKMLLTAGGRKPEKNAGSAFSDVSNGDWYFDYINTAYEMKLIEGYDNKFSPDNCITREDAAVILHRYLSDYTLPDGTAVLFRDKKDISAYAANSVNALAEAGIFKGDTNKRFNPKNNLTRAEIAALLCRITDLISAAL